MRRAVRGRRADREPVPRRRWADGRPPPRRRHWADREPVPRRVWADGEGAAPRWADGEPVPRAARPTASRRRSVMLHRRKSVSAPSGPAAGPVSPEARTGLTIGPRPRSERPLEHTPVLLVDRDCRRGPTSWSGGRTNLAALAKWSSHWTGFTGPPDGPAIGPDSLARTAGPAAGPDSPKCTGGPATGPDLTVSTAGPDIGPRWAARGRQSKVKTHLRTEGQRTGVVRYDGLTNFGGLANRSGHWTAPRGANFECGPERVPVCVPVLMPVCACVCACRAAPLRAFCEWRRFTGIRDAPPEVFRDVKRPGSGRARCSAAARGRRRVQGLMRAAPGARAHAGGAGCKGSCGQRLVQSHQRPVLGPQNRDRPGGRRRQTPPGCRRREAGGAEETAGAR